MKDINNQLKKESKAIGDEVDRLFLMDLNF